MFSFHSVPNATEEGTYSISPDTTDAYISSTDVPRNPCYSNYCAIGVDSHDFCWRIRDRERGTSLTLFRSDSITDWYIGHNFVCYFNALRFCASVRVLTSGLLAVTDAGFVLVLVIVQFLAFTWYSLSYIPYARTAVKNIMPSFL